MQVELDIFSGRPNPRWELSSETAQELRNKLADLSEGAPLRPQTTGLGYRGLIVRSEKLEDFEELVIYNEVVASQRGDRLATFVDKGRSIEKWLLSTGKPFLGQDLYQQLLSEIH